MARRAKDDPDAQIAERQEKHAKLVRERGEAEREKHKALIALEVRERGPNAVGAGTLHPPAEGELTIPKRRELAEAARDLGREHEPFEAIDKDERDERQALVDSERGIASKTKAMATLEDEIKDIKANNLEFFARKAHARSLEAVAATEVRKQAQADEELKRKAAEGGWGIVRDGRDRLKWPILRGVPTAEGLKEGRAPWPGDRELDEQTLPATWTNDNEPRGPRMSNAEALADFERVG